MASTDDQLFNAFPTGFTINQPQSSKATEQQLQTLEAALRARIAASGNIGGAAPTVAHQNAAIVALLILVADNGASSSLNFGATTFFFNPANAAPLHNTGVPINDLLAIVRLTCTLRQWVRARANLLLRLGRARSIKWQFGRKGGMPDHLQEWGFDGADHVTIETIPDVAAKALATARAVSIGRTSVAISNAPIAAASQRFRITNSSAFEVPTIEEA